METLIDTEVDAAQQMLLLNAVETYLELNQEQEMKYSQRVSSNPRKSEVVAMEMTWADKMQERGRREGVEVGQREGVEVSQRLLLKLLAQRFGRVPQEMQQRVANIKNLTALESLSDRVFSSSTLEDLDLPSGESETLK